jgi:hypothetical protein
MNQRENSFFEIKQYKYNYLRARRDGTNEFCKRLERIDGNQDV